MVCLMDYKHPSKAMVEVSLSLLSIPRVDRLLNLKNSVATGMKLWRGLGSSISPKIPAIEDHLVGQVRRHSGIRDYCKDFIEKSQKNGRAEIKTALS